MNTTRETAAQKKERKRKEAEERNARPKRTLDCGHTTSLGPTTHGIRCGAIA